MFEDFVPQEDVILIDEVCPLQATERSAVCPLKNVYGLTETLSLDPQIDVAGGVPDPIACEPVIECSYEEVICEQQPVECAEPVICDEVVMPSQCEADVLDFSMEEVPVIEPPAEPAPEAIEQPPLDGTTDSFEGDPEDLSETKYFKIESRKTETQSHRVRDVVPEDPVNAVPLKRVDHTN